MNTFSLFLEDNSQVRTKSLWALFLCNLGLSPEVATIIRVYPSFYLDRLSRVIFSFLLSPVAIVSNV